MESLSEYIPLILILGSVIFSAIRGNAKKNKENTAKTTLPGKESSDEFNFPDLLSQGKPAKKGKKKKKPAKIEPAVVRNVAVPLVKDNHQFETEEIEVSNEGVFNIRDIADTDELKKAFIYTEILGRREY